MLPCLSLFTHIPRRILIFSVAFALLVALCTVPVLAEDIATQDRIYYINHTVAGTTATENIDSISTYTLLTAANISSHTTWNEGWYVVSGAGTISTSTRIAVSGDVHVILLDGCILNASKGITVETGNSFTIYAGNTTNNDIQRSGRLITETETELGACIGSQTKSDELGVNAGNITIHGGTVTANVIGGNAGIGGGRNTNVDTITIYNGTVEVTQTGGSGAGIGNGGYNVENHGTESIITIYGGTIRAAGGISSQFGGGAGIGNGRGVNGGSIYIYGGTITAIGGYGGAGIGGGGTTNLNQWETGGSVDVIYIVGGTIEAIGGNAGGAGIGGGAGSSKIGGSVANITISGGTVNATSTAADGAGIGSGTGAEGTEPSSLNTTDTGTAVITTSSITANTDGVTSAIITNTSDSTTTVYGDQTLTGDFTVSSGQTLVVSDGATLTVPDDAALTVEGTLNVQNTATGAVKGTVEISGGGHITTPENSQTYGSSVTEATGGKVTVSPALASKDTLVTITVSVDTGYAVSGVSVTTGEETITITDLGGLRYTFTMPASDVSIAVSFVQVTGENYIITLPDSVIVSPDPNTQTTFPVTVSGLSSSSVSVTITGGTNEADRTNFYMSYTAAAQDDAAKLLYTLKEGDTSITNGGTLTFTPSGSSGAVIKTLSVAIGNPLFAGDYTDTLTFRIAVEEKESTAT